MVLIPSEMQGRAVRVACAASCIATALGCTRDTRTGVATREAPPAEPAEPVEPTDPAGADARPATEDAQNARNARGVHDAQDADAPAPPLPPIADRPLFTNLTVTGYPEPVVSVPNGATSRRPVILVAHGTSDRPDWNCDAWRHITSARGFVVCPRGEHAPQESTRDDERFTLRGGAYLLGYVDAALAALAVRFAGYVDVDRPVLAGFSLGATEMAQLAVRDPARFPRIAMLEGGQKVWTAAAIRQFEAGGGQRVLFGCGSPWCVPETKAVLARFDKAGFEARMVSANVGHTNDRPLQEAVMAQLEWFLGGDARWRGAW